MEISVNTGEMGIRNTEVAIPAPYQPWDKLQQQAGSEIQDSNPTSKPEFGYA